MSGFPIKPLPRWTILPGDPAPLKRWLIEQAAMDAAVKSPPVDRGESPDEDAGRAA